MMRWPAKAEVCLAAGKTASGRKTETETRGENRPKRPKNRREDEFRLKPGLFPQPVKPNVDVIGFIGPTKVVPWLQSHWELPRDEFLRACKVVPFQNRGYELSFYAACKAQLSF